ncbi:hypothetical protein GCM10025860_15440 [Methanobacterium ferruginis]|nr:hypothetical protein GCM10025860_15440 [Methanobacterium ferruginis]
MAIKPTTTIKPISAAGPPAEVFEEPEVSPTSSAEFEIVEFVEFPSLSFVVV